MGLVILGGTVVVPGGSTVGGLRVVDGVVAAIGPEVTSGRGDVVVDAGGCFVLPGGVDPHCHAMADLAGATQAAAMGGTTTVLSFTSPEDGETPGSALRRARDVVAGGGSATDVGLHAACYQPDELSDDDVSEVVALGADALKVFLAYPELGIMASGGGLYRAMGYAARWGLPLQVHCEDGELIEALVQQAAAAPIRSTVTFAQVRPAVAEELAVERVLAFAALAGVDCYLPHLSTAGGLDAVRAARSRAGRAEDGGATRRVPPSAAGGGGRGPGGRRVIAEACIHHIVADEGVYATARGEDWLVAPPLRSATDVAALGAALADGTVDTVGSDHSEAPTPVDPRIASSSASDYGIAGIGARLPLLLSWGAAAGLPIGRLVQVASSGPAEAFGYPAKGRLVPGADGDVVVWDPSARSVLGVGRLAPDGTGRGPYAGWEVAGAVRFACARGVPLVDDGSWIGPADGGRVLTPRRLRWR